MRLILERTPPIVLSIAGSDSSGGAGIQADLNTFHAYGVHGLTVITAVTAQNTSGLKAIHSVPVEHVAHQLDAVFSDFDIAAVKIGMLSNISIVRLVTAKLREYQAQNVVLDPVLRASVGGDLLDNSALEELRGELLPLVRVLTPNLPEAERLLERRLLRAEELDVALTDLGNLGCACVVLKGGHVDGTRVQDRFWDGTQKLSFRHQRLPIDAHGTGCTLAAAIAAGLAYGWDPAYATRRACTYVNRALRGAFRPGKTSTHLLRHRGFRQ